MPYYIEYDDSGNILRSGYTTKQTFADKIKKGIKIMAVESNSSKDIDITHKIQISGELPGIKEKNK